VEGSRMREGNVWKEKRSKEGRNRGEIRKEAYSGRFSSLVELFKRRKGINCVLLCVKVKVEFHVEHSYTRLQLFVNCFPTKTILARPTS
jgi:hypothetical protein